MNSRIWRQKHIRCDYKVDYDDVGEDDYGDDDDGDDDDGDDDDGDDDKDCDDDDKDNDDDEYDVDGDDDVDEDNLRVKQLGSLQPWQQTSFLTVVVTFCTRVCVTCLKNITRHVIVTPLDRLTTGYRRFRLRICICAHSSS